MKFTKIGVGTREMKKNKKTGKNKPQIHLQIDCRALSSMPTIDIGRSLYVFPDGEFQERAVVFGCTPDDYFLNEDALLENTKFGKEETDHE